MTFLNVLTNVVMSFPTGAVKVPYRIYKALKVVDAERLYPGSFYHMIKGERKQMGNWRLI